MAADVLVYKTTTVPVGADQLQHLELARDIARAFNRYVDRDVFPEPKPLLTSSAKILSLTDGSVKMSKSAASAASRIDMTDDADTIARKIRRAKTDSVLPYPTFDPEHRPEVSNLLSIFSAVTGQPVDTIEKGYAGGGASMARFKTDLADAVAAKVVPVGREIDRLYDDPLYLDGVLEAGAAVASELAEPTMFEVRHALGLSDLVSASYS